MKSLFTHTLILIVFSIYSLVSVVPVFAQLDASEALDQTNTNASEPTQEQTEENPLQPNPVATDATPSATPEAAFYVADRVINEKRREELMALYQQQVEDYAEKERLFTISKAQWKSLQTLGSLEEAVTRTREVMVSRDRVMITYLELILNSLTETLGIEITQKELSTDDLTKQIEWLREHQKRAETAKDRDQVNIVADEFSAQFETINIAAQRAFALVIIGKLQTIVDKGDVLYVRIIQYYQQNPGTVTEQAVRQRNIAQIQKQRDQITTEIKKARVPVEERKDRVKNIGASSIVQLMETPYTKTSQYLSYLYELAKGNDEQ